MEFTARGDTMHASDRTLVHKLCNDSDRKSSRHELACHYLAREEVATKVLRAAYPSIAKAEAESYITRYGIESVKTTFEYHVTKGEGKYQTTIGFVDLMIAARVLMPYLYEEKVYKPTHRGPDGKLVHGAFETVQLEGKSLDHLALGIEVKTQPVPASDVVRQIKLYKEYCPTSGNAGADVRWALVADYPLSPLDREMLASEAICAFELGDSFDVWVAEQADRDNPNRPAATIL